MIDLIAIVGGFLAQTQLLSHITRRLVDSFAVDSTTSRAVVQTAIPACGTRELFGEIEPRSRDFNVGEIVFSPPPVRFIPLLDDQLRFEGRLVMGAVVDEFPPFISWSLVQPDVPSVFVGTETVVGVVFALLPVRPETMLRVLRIRDDGSVEGHNVIALNASEPWSRAGLIIEGS